MMKAGLKFWVDPNDDQRWLRMTLIGDDWPLGWNVPYSYLDSWGMLTWFFSPPPDPDGIVADQNYRMSDTPQAHEFAGFIENLHTLISQIRPTPDPESGLVIEDVREYV